MGNWGDDYDPEVLNKKEPRGRVTINFKKISYDIDEIIESTSVVDEKHPKTDIFKEWIGTMIGFFLLFLCAYQIFIFVTIPFFFFFFMALGKIFKAWKSFGYKVSSLTLLTICVMVAEFAIALFAQRFYPF